MRTRWEYRIETIEHEGAVYTAAEYLALVRPLGQEGWEAYKETGSTVSFKRPVK